MRSQSSFDQSNSIDVPKKKTGDTEHSIIDLRVNSRNMKRNSNLNPRTSDLRQGAVFN